MCPEKTEVKTICAQETGGSIKQEPQEGEGMSLPTIVEQSMESLPEVESAQLRVLLSEYANLFAQEDTDLGSTEVVSHSINTGDHPPI